MSAGAALSSTPQACAVVGRDCGLTGAISSAPKGALSLLIGGSGTELSYAEGALEFVAKMLKVFLADLQLQDFLDEL